MIDTHAHIHDAQYDDDREATIARARAAGVNTIVTIGCDLGDSERAIRAAETYGLLATVGIHPHEAKDAPADIAAAFDRLRADASAPIVAIGETGLDYHYNHSPAEDQRRVLRDQIAYARAGVAGRLPPARSVRRFVAILREIWDRTTMRGVIHCFTGNAARGDHVRRGIRHAARHRRRADVQDGRAVARSRTHRRSGRDRAWKRIVPILRRFRIAANATSPRSLSKAQTRSRNPRISAATRHEPRQPRPPDNFSA